MDIISRNNLKLYHCDNLQCLESLSDNSVDLIYSDILYATGKKLNDFIDLKPIKSEVEKHYIPRFQEMHRVLSETGTIYLQMDWRINHWIRCLMDDIFGYSNFRNEIIWSYNSAPRKKACFGNRHDTILRYSKSDEFTFNESEVREPYALSAPRGYEKEKYYNPDGKVMGDVWTINILGQNDKTERIGYDTQKPKKLIDRIIRVSTKPGDTVADFYAGSHTTGECALLLDRNYIGCDNTERSFELAQQRLRKWIYAE